MGGRLQSIATRGRWPSRGVTTATRGRWFRITAPEPSSGAPGVTFGGILLAGIRFGQVVVTGIRFGSIDRENL